MKYNIDDDVHARAKVEGSVSKRGTSIDSKP